MAGAEQFVDVLALATGAKKGPTNVTRVTSDATGALMASVKGAPTIPLASAIGAHPSGFNFTDETLAWAQILMPDLGFDRVVGSDCLPIWELALAGANPPVIDGFFNGGVLSFSGAGTSWVALNPVTPGAATYNPVIGNSFQTRATAWFARARLFINAVQFTSGKELVLLSMDASYVGGAGTGHAIQLVGIGATSPTQVQVRLAGNNFAAGPTLQSAGPDGNLGCDNSLCPVNQWFTVTLYFDGAKLRWAFSDSYNNPANPNAIDFTTGLGDAMGQDAAAVTVNNSATNDLTIGANFKIDALACAYCSSQENK